MGTESAARAAGSPQRRKPGRPKKSEAQDTKAALLQAAVRLFAENGYAGTSIRAIAREVGLSESVLYAHYGSKQEIFDAATRRLGPAGVRSVLAELDAEGVDRDPARCLRQLCERAIDVWDTEEARRWMSMITREGLVHEQFFSAAVEDAIAVLARHLAVWIDDGQVRRLGPPGDLVFAFMGPLVQARILGLHAGATQAVRATARTRMRRHTEFFLRAVLAEPPEGTAGDGGS